MPFLQDTDYEVQIENMGKTDYYPEKNRRPTSGGISCTGRNGKLPERAVRC